MKKKHIKKQANTKNSHFSQKMMLEIGRKSRARKRVFIAIFNEKDYLTKEQVKLRQIYQNDKKDLQDKIIARAKWGAPKGPELKKIEAQLKFLAEEYQVEAIVLKLECERKIMMGQRFSRRLEAKIKAKN